MKRHTILGIFYLAIITLVYSQNKMLEYDHGNKLGYEDEVKEKIQLLKDSLKSNSCEISGSKFLIDKGCIPFDKTTPFQMSYLQHFVFAYDSIFPKFIEDGFYYVNTETNEIVIPKRFNEAYPFLNNSALVRFDDKYAVIDEKGDYIIEPTYSIPDFKTLKGAYITLIGDSAYSFISKEKLSFGQCHLRTIRDIILDPILYYAEKVGNKYGVKEEFSHEIIIEPIYDSIYYCDDINDFIIAKLNDKIGIIDFQNNIKIPFENDSVILGLTNDFFWESQEVELSNYGLLKSGNWSYYSTSRINKPLFVSPYKIISFTNHKSFNYSSLGVYEIGGKYNVLSVKGISLPHNYDWIHPDGIIGKRGDVVYLILDDGTEIPYYNYNTEPKQVTRLEQ